MTQDFQNGEDRADEADAEQRPEVASEWPAADLRTAEGSESTESWMTAPTDALADAPTDTPTEAPAAASFAADDSDAPVSLGEAPAEPSEDLGDEKSSDTPYDESSDDSALDELDDEDERDEFEVPDDGERVELRNSGVRDIDATTVSITQGGARDVEATNVTINQGGAARIHAEEVTITQGGVGLVRTDRLTLEEGGTAFAVIAENAELSSDTSVFLLVAGSTSGDVQPFLDWRAAAAFGAGFALILALLRRGRR